MATASRTMWKSAEDGAAAPAPLVTAVFHIVRLAVAIPSHGVHSWICAAACSIGRRYYVGTCGTAATAAAAMIRRGSTHRPHRPWGGGRWRLAAQDLLAGHQHHGGQQRGDDAQADDDRQAQPPSAAPAPLACRLAVPAGRGSLLAGRLLALPRLRRGSAPLLLIARGRFLARSFGPRRTVPAGLFARIRRLL